MKELKYIIAGLLLVGIAMSLSITVPTQLQTVSKGQVADFTVIIDNNEAAQNVLISTDSNTFVSITEPAFYLEEAGTKTIQVLAVTNGLNEGLHLIELEINEQKVNLAVNVREGVHYLVFNSVYSKVKATQGEYQDLKFIIRNEGRERIRNVVVKGDIPASLSPVYPEAFNMDANEVKEIKVRITVPRDYPADEYDLLIRAGAGNLVVKDSVILSVEGTAPLKDRLEVDVLLPWSAIKEEGKTVGYEITLRMKNRGISDVNGITWKFSGMPEDWEVSGTDEFNIAGYETIDKTIRIVPSTFTDTPVNITLMRGNEEISSKQLTLAGYKIGKAPTGMFLFGGSAAIGIIVVIALALALLYVRGRNAEADQTEETQTKDYLEKLVEKARKEQKKK